MPGLEGLNRIRVDVPFQLARLVTLLPDHALQRLKRRGFAVFGDPLLEDLDHPLNVRLGLAAVQAHRPQLHRNLRVFGMITDEVRQVFGRKRKQHVKHKADGAGGAFNVSEDGFDRHTVSLVFEAREAAGDVFAGKVGHPAFRVVKQPDSHKVRVLAHIKPMRGARWH